jgi:hypothetical protein
MPSEGSGTVMNISAVIIAFTNLVCYKVTDMNNTGKGNVGEKIPQAV